MTPSHLLDTDVVIDVIRRRDPTAQARLESLGPAVAISSVSVMELSYGAARSSRPAENQRAVEEFLAFVPSLAFDRLAAEHAGQVRAELAATGTPIGAYDVLLAGQARSMALVLATGNVAEFSRVAGLRCLDWAGATGA